jgi:hypothetical protein
MSMMDIINSGNSFPVFKFCKDNGIKCSWDFSKKDQTEWTEIYLDDDLFMQIQSTATVEQFIELIQTLKKDFTDKCENIKGEDFWFVVNGKRYFNKFMNLYGHLFE